MIRSFILPLALVGISVRAAEESPTSPTTPTQCERMAVYVENVASRSKEDPVELLELIDREVAANPSCSCEIVKAAITGTNSDPAIIGYIVETAIHSAPDQMRLIAQCAIATAPDSLTRVQEVLNRLDPNAGEKGYSSKSAKSAKSPKEPEVKPAQAPPDPLDIPIIGIPPVPPVINPPVGTRPDFVPVPRR